MMAQKIQEFVDKWLGKQIRDGQCVSMYREYTEIFLGMPTLERLGADGGAELLFFKYGSMPVSQKYLELIPYTIEDMRPQPGDAVIFKANENNKYGHVGLFVGATESGNMEIFDQNGIAALRGEPVKSKISIWGMARVLGWLRPRSL